MEEAGGGIDLVADRHLDLELSGLDESGRSWTRGVGAATIGFPGGWAASVIFGGGIDPTVCPMGPGGEGVWVELKLFARVRPVHTKLDVVAALPKKVGETEGVAGLLGEPCRGTAENAD